MADKRLNGLSEEEIETLHEQNAQQGFDVRYEEKVGNHSMEYELDINIEEEDATWDVAKYLGIASKGKYTNIHVIYRRDIHGKSSPVFNYEKRMIENE